MNEKRFIKLKSEWVDINFPIIWDTCNETGLNVEQAVNVLNEQQEQISYWKHKVSSLLWILSQFDEEKVKELLKELEDE